MKTGFAGGGVKSKVIVVVGPSELDGGVELTSCCLFAGRFENGKGPIPSRPGLFTDCLFLLTHVDKHPTTLAEEKRQLQDSSMESSTGESTDDGEMTKML